MPEEADPYAFNAPQYADLASEAKAGGAMSPATRERGSMRRRLLHPGDAICKDQKNRQ